MAASEARKQCARRILSKGGSAPPTQTYLGGARGDLVQTTRHPRRRSVRLIFSGPLSALLKRRLAMAHVERFAQRATSASFARAFSFEALGEASVRALASFVSPPSMQKDHQLVRHKVGGAHFEVLTKVLGMLYNLLSTNPVHFTSPALCSSSGREKSVGQTCCMQMRYSRASQRRRRRKPLTSGKPVCKVCSCASSTTL